MTGKTKDRLILAAWALASAITPFITFLVLPGHPISIVVMILTMTNTLAFAHAKRDQIRQRQLLGVYDQGRSPRSN